MIVPSCHLLVICCQPLLCNVPHSIAAKSLNTHPDRIVPLLHIERYSARVAERIPHQHVAVQPADDAHNLCIAICAQPVADFTPETQDAAAVALLIRRNALDDVRAGHVILDGDAAAGKSQLVEELRTHLSPAERPWVERAVRLLPTLSPREEDVVRRLAASHNTQGIVETLGISHKTVEHHVRSLYDKLGLSDADAAAPTLRKATLLAKACMIYDLTR